MIIAHLPAGYLVARSLQRQKYSATAFGALLLGSLFPDFDMLYFYTIGQTQIHHHRYITHIPAYYVMAGAIGAGVLTFLNKTHLLKGLGFFLAGVMLHMALDSVVGWIYWLKPFSDAKIGGHIFVDAKYGWWIWNFVFHWTMLIELTIVSLAGWAFIADWRGNRWGSSEA